MIHSVLFLLFCGLMSVHAKLSMPNSISSNMVLQRAPQSPRIWGMTSRAGDVITAFIDDDRYQVFSSADGSFSIEFQPYEASVGRTLKVADGDEQIVYENIAFGDVYICSGQSNMEFALRDSFDNATAIPDSKNYPNLRLLAIKEKSSLTPYSSTTTRFADGSNWVVSAPQYVDGPSFNYFSAVCYYFGRELYKAVNVNGQVVPIGVIDTCWGGTVIEAWTTPAGLAVCPTGSKDNEQDVDIPEAHANSYRTHQSSRVHSHRVTKYEADPDPNTPSVLWYGMINPILKMKVRGVVWYQGESNAAKSQAYYCQFPAMINDWRNQFNNYDMFFGFVLLAAYQVGGDPGFGRIRAAQLAAMSLPLVHVASAQDLGDPSSPFTAIHPRNKTFVGARLALGAQKMIYQQDVLSVGPIVADIIWPSVSASTQSVIVRFNPSLQANTGLGLRDTSQCTFCCKDISGSALTVTTSDNVWRRAHVTVDSVAFIAVATVTDLPAGVSVIAVQHGYENYQQCAVYNAEGLPMLPFNTARF